MNLDLHERIKAAARPYYTDEDRSHDFSHIERVAYNATFIQSKEGGDLDIILPAAYFHDCIKYPKSHERAKFSAQESADEAEKILLTFPDYDPAKIPAVKAAIIEHSFSANLAPSSLESAIIQDADRLEATGALGIARTFASTGFMAKPFYDGEDPFKTEKPLDEKNIAIDLFFTRLLIVGERMNTQTARAMAEPRTALLQQFLEQFGTEIGVPYQPRLKP